MVFQEMYAPAYNVLAGSCISGNFEADNEWAIIGGMRRDAKLTTEEDGGSRETMQITLTSTAAVGGSPNNATMRVFFKYGEEYNRLELTLLYTGFCLCKVRLCRFFPKRNVSRSVL